MKTDSDLKKDVLSELSWDPLVPEARIGVAVHAGVVTLSGRVHSWAERNAAEGVTWSAPGVSRVVNQLVIEA